MKLLQTTIVLLAIGLSSFAQQRPKLVIFMSVDQMRADYLERFRNDFTGGFRRMIEEGTVFKNADLNYAPSETGPGHATLASGCYPWKSGILSNDWLDPRTRKDVYCVQDTSAEKTGNEGGGVSPRNLMVTALGDWLKEASPESKVVAVSAKDRAAVLMGGQHPTCAFWYDHVTGHMVTSTYYTNEAPFWVKHFNSGTWIDRNLPPAWTKLKPDDWYTKIGPDELKGERPWDGSTSFPHKFLRDKKRDQILASPYGDHMILDFARSAIGAERLGLRGATDLLCISLSRTDYIGHAFGPNSQEMADQMLRLDQALGSFFSDVEKIVGKGNLLVALSADHAVLALPEYTTTVLHQPARRIFAKTIVNPAIDSLDARLEQSLKIPEHIILSDAFLNYTAASRSGLDSLQLEALVRDGLLKIDGIASIYFRRELVGPPIPGRHYLAIFQHGYYPLRGEDFLVRFCEGCLVTSSSTGTSHGSPYAYDTHVPVVFWGMGVKHESVNRRVHSADIAPTIITKLGFGYPGTIDGVPLEEIIH